MKLLDRYMLREYVITVIYCVVAFALVQIVYDLFYRFTKLLAANVSALQMARYYLGYLAPRLEFMLPASLLLATLYTLWQFSRHGELTAMRASGVSLYRLMLPFLAVGLVFSVLTAVLKETLAPREALWAEEFRQNNFHEPDGRLYHNLAYYNALDRRPWRIELHFPRVLARFLLESPMLLSQLRILEPWGLDFHSDDLDDFSVDMKRRCSGVKLRGS